MSEVKSRPRHKPCIECGQKKASESFYWYPYITMQGKKSVRRESRCKECARQLRRERYAKNPSKDLASSGNWKTRNKERMLAKQSEYKKTSGRAICNASIAKRQAAQLQRVPAWSDLDAIESFYDQAAELGLTVDHIVPLQGERVSGLHVPQNLQLLSKSENSRKKNSFEVL